MALEMSSWLVVLQNESMFASVLYPGVPFSPSRAASARTWRAASRMMRLSRLGMSPMPGRMPYRSATLVRDVRFRGINPMGCGEPAFGGFHGQVERDPLLATVQPGCGPLVLGIAILCGVRAFPGPVGGDDLRACGSFFPDILQAFAESGQPCRQLHDAWCASSAK